MQVQKLLVLLLAVTALSGCFGGDSDDDHHDDDGHGHDDDGHGDGGNEAVPTRSIILTPDVLTGLAPLTVNFTFDAQPAENVTYWTIQFGAGTEGLSGSGFELPGTASHTFEENGTFEVTFTADFFDGESLNSTMVIEAAAPDLSGVTPDYFVTYEDSASFGVPYTSAGPAPGASEFVKNAIDAGLNGTFLVYYEVPVLPGAKQLRAEATADAIQGVVPDYDMYVYDPDGAGAGSSTNGGTAELVEVSNPSEGTWIVALLYWAGTPANDPFTLTIAVTYS